MRKRAMAAVVLLLLCAATASAESYSGIPDKFFGYLAQGKANEAIDYLYGTNQWVARNSDQVTNLKGELSKLNGLVGKYLFHELIVEQKVGNRYAHLIYLVGYERQPLRFEIKVYKASNEWRFLGVSFDAKITDDIEKLANEKVVK
jgi:hypothetical protein